MRRERERERERERGREREGEREKEREKERESKRAIPTCPGNPFISSRLRRHSANYVYHTHYTAHPSWVVN